jgi:hypothetical protein
MLFLTSLRRELRHRMRQAVVIAAGSPWESPPRG